MSAKLGRNDPCHCGSGKKYKKCHLPMDEQARWASVASASVECAAEPGGSGAEHEPEEPQDENSFPDWAQLGSGEALGPMKQLAQAFTMAKRSGLFNRDPEFQRIFKENEAVLTYIARQEQIEAASEKLQPFHAEFDRLCRDPAAYERRTQALFQEPAFAPFRFTAADLRRAFNEVGVPQLDSTSKKAGKLVRKALLLLAAKERRQELTMRLLTLMPEYTQRGRHLDALLIESCAHLTAERIDQPNAFLGRMFLYGLEAWAAEQDASRNALLQESGFDLDPEAAPEAIENWLEQQLDDPESPARWQRLLDAHPEFQPATAETSFQLTARKAVALFDREDSARLFLAPEEIQPWEPMLLEKLQGLLERFGPPESGRKVSKSQSKKAFDQVYLPAMQEIAKGVFTPERIRRLVADLKAYRKELAAAGDKPAMLCAISAIIYVEQETEPEMNAFLINLCARSVMRAGALAEVEPGEAAGNKPATK